MNFSRRISRMSADRRGNTIFLVFVLAVLVVVSITFANNASGESGLPPGKKWKILHIMSYHSPWKWTDDQLEGFKHALRGLDIEYKVFQMDTKRNSTEDRKRKVGREARNLIDKWKPDLVYTNDDNAQKYVAKYYINAAIPFVFSGVNTEPKAYGFAGSKNVTGVLEQEHFVGTVLLLREIVPNVKKIAIIVDEGPTWDGVIERMKAKLNELPDVKFVSWNVIKTFKGFKQKMKELQREADAVGLLGIFTYKDEAGNNVPYTEVLRWTVENSNLPDFSFWKDRISYGTLCTVTVSGYEQGLAAGRMARGILVEGKSPSSYKINPTVKGEPVISLARANKLGIRIKTGILLSAGVVQKFAWDK